MRRSAHRNFQATGRTQNQDEYKIKYKIFILSGLIC
jgi:hypothetical protein